MIRSAVTISLVTQARGGPFVFWDDLPGACAKAAELGFDAVELFAPDPTAVDAAVLSDLLRTHKLGLAAVGTGAGMVIHGLSLTSPNTAVRTKGREFIQQVIDLGAKFEAPAIIGSMQGKWGGEIDRNAALDLLAESLNSLGEYAGKQGVPLIYEPLNRYETNLINTMADGVKFLDTLETKNVKLLADLFHMNIEETELAAGIRDGGAAIGHVHFVDSNRRAVGAGHMEIAPIAAALAEIGYDGYLSAEALPLPDSNAAAEQTIQSFRKYFR